MPQQPTSARNIILTAQILVTQLISTSVKREGAFRTDYNLSLMSDTYDPNDMGYIRRNNELEHSVDFSYNVFEPKGNLMMQRYSLDFSYDQLYKPRVFTSSAIELGSMIVFMNYWSLSVDAWITPVG